MTFAGRVLLFSAGLLLAGSLASPALRAQSQPDAPAYVPYQYIPLNGPGAAANADPNAPLSAAPSPDAVQKKDPSAPADTPSDTVTTSTPSFKPLTAATRPPETDSGFAPVVGTSSDLVHSALVQSEGGIPRLYAPGFRLGPFDIRPTASLSTTYNDNIYLAPAHSPHTGDYITSLNPTLDISYGNTDPGDVDGTQFDLSYSPTGLVFSQNDDNSTLNQQLNASLAHSFSKLRLGIGQRYAHISGGFIGAGDLVTEDFYNTNLDADYALTPKTSLELAGDYTNTSYSTGYGAQEYDASGFINYELRPKLIVSVAPSFSYLVPENGSGGQTAIGGLFRVAYNYSEKTSFYGQIGGDERQYQGSSLSTIDWSYLAGFQWAAGPKTTLALTASRSTKSSNITADQDDTASNVGMFVSQLLVRGISAGFSAGYEHTDYFSTVTGASTFSYDYFSVSPSLLFHPSIWCDVGLSYLFRQNLSDTGVSEFTNNQIGLFSTVRF